MARRADSGEEGSAAILAEARRILDDGDAAALRPSVSLAELAEALADRFDLSYTAERVLDLLEPERRRALEARLPGHPAAEEAGDVGIRLPADLAERLREIADPPVEAIRALLESHLPEPGSEEHCRRRRCAPRTLLSDPDSWACDRCGLTGRSDRPLNPVIRERLADQTAHAQALHALAAGLYDAWALGARFTAADCTAQRLPGARIDRGRLKHHLADLMEAGVIEEAPGPRGGAGYRLLDEAPDWIADAIAERRRQAEAEAEARQERAAAVERVLEEGLTHTTARGETVAIHQSARGLELKFPAIPGWELREAMKRQGQCRWDAQRRRWCRPSPVTTVEPWLAEALEEGATVEPYGSADPDVEQWSPTDWSNPDWPD